MASLWSWLEQIVAIAFHWEGIFAAITGNPVR